MGAEIGAVVDRLLDSRPVVEQAYVPAGNILGLSKDCSPQLFERICVMSNALGAVPSHTSFKNAILAIRPAVDGARESDRRREATGDGALVDRAKSAVRLRGADTYRRESDGAC